MGFLKKVHAFDGSGSGPVGTKGIEENISFEKGRAKPIDEKPKPYLWSVKDRGGKVPETQPDAPKVDDHTFPFNGKPNVRPSFRWNDEKPKPAKVKEMLSFLSRVYAQSAPKQEFFPELLKKVKASFPDMKMKFPKPPTYVWNPKDEEAPLDAKKIKDSLKVRLPDLVWSDRHDGVHVAVVEFPDFTNCEFAIGQDADHLTLTYHVEGS